MILSIICHSFRVARLSKKLAAEAGLSPAAVREVYWAALLHDTGKLKVPKSIIGSPNALSKSEYEIIKKHTGVGVKMLKSLPVSISKTTLRVAKEHHERCDGSGYHGKANICVEARIVAIADVYDAITSKRTYKKARPPHKAVECICIKEKGKYDKELSFLLCKLLSKKIEKVKIATVYSGARMSSKGNDPHKEEQL